MAQRSISVIDMEPDEGAAPTLAAIEALTVTLVGGTDDIYQGVDYVMNFRYKFERGEFKSAAELAAAYNAYLTKRQAIIDAI